jgi:hypothetical protein
VDTGQAFGMASEKTKKKKSVTDQKAENKEDEIWNGWNISTLFCVTNLGVFPFVVGLLLLFVKSNPEAVEIGGEPPPYEQWRLTQMAFLTCLLLDFISFLWTVDKEKSRLFYFVLVINGLPVISYGLLASGFAPILLDAHGRRLIILRYVVWLFTTPAMLYLYSIVSCIPRRELAMAMGLEYLVIITGFLACILPSIFGLIALAVRPPSSLTSSCPMGRGG